MLIKHRSLVTSRSYFVNKALLGMATVAALSAPLTATALPSLASINKTVHTVKFSRAELTTPKGVQSVYEKLAKEAVSACQVGRAVNKNGKAMSKAECTSDLLAQFVTNASIDALTDYHKVNDFRVKTASLNVK